MNTSHAICTDAYASRFIKAFWQMHGEPAHQFEIILPKGVVELIFSFDEPMLYNPGDPSKTTSTPNCFINGLTIKPLDLQSPKRQHFFGVILRPAAVRKILKIPAGEFLNQVIDLEGIEGGFTELWYKLAEANEFAERVTIVEEWVKKGRSIAPEQELAISDYLTSPHTPASVAELAKHFCYSDRQLNRKSRELFGMSTEAMLRYKRYLTALAILHQSEETLTSIGYDSNYFDQAHFSREFRAFTQLTPREYRQQKSGLPGHLYKNVRYVQG